MFNIEEKAFLKQINTKDTKALIREIRKIEPDDDFSREFLNDLLDKLEKVKDDTIKI